MVLTLLLACPLIGMLVILVLPTGAVRAVRGVALVSTASALAVSLKLLCAFQSQLATVQFQERVAWIPQLRVF